MESKTVRPKAKEIQARFFQAIDMLIESGKIKSLNSFCEHYGLHRPKYSNIRSYSKDQTKLGTGYKFIDIDALAYLVADFGVSSDWLLLGKGGMFTNKKTRNITVSGFSVV
jgi:hypothetical protein